MTQFTFLCLSICFAMAAFLIVVGTVAAETTWRCLRRIGFDPRVLNHSSLLFAIRTLPISVPAAVVLCGVLPSFLAFEPRQTVEKPEWWILATAALAFVFIGFMICRLASTLFITWRTARRWLRSARKLDVAAPIPIYALRDPSSLVAVIGIVSPRMYIGTRILDCLGEEELRAAIAHELAHVHSLDNLKQALLSATRFSPSFGEIDRAFRNAVEIGADSRAMRVGISPLDLSAAIVKVARLKFAPALPAIAASHLVPDLEASTLQLRVEHLQAALEDAPPRRAVDPCGWLAASALTTAYVIKLSLVLSMMHNLTELLVR